jgi:hypothetical protein
LAVRLISTTTSTHWSVSSAVDGAGDVGATEVGREAGVDAGRGATGPAQGELHRPVAVRPRAGAAVVAVQYDEEQLARRGARHVGPDPGVQRPGRESRELVDDVGRARDREGVRRRVRVGC